MYLNHECRIGNIDIHFDATSFKYYLYFNLIELYLLHFVDIFDFFCQLRCSSIHFYRICEPFLRYSTSKKWVHDLILCRENHIGDKFSHFFSSVTAQLEIWL